MKNEFLAESGRVPAPVVALRQHPSELNVIAVKILTTTITGESRNFTALFNMNDAEPELWKLHIEVARDEWRPGDQRVFYADFRKAKRELGWEPKIDLEEGMELLFDWIKDNKDLF